MKTINFIKGMDDNMTGEISLPATKDFGGKILQLLRPFHSSSDVLWGRQ